VDGVRADVRDPETGEIQTLLIDDVIAQVSAGPAPDHEETASVVVSMNSADLAIVCRTDDEVIAGDRVRRSSVVDAGDRFQRSDSTEEQTWTA
jgi:hypothetical protein